MAVLRQRLISGSLLTAGLIGLMVIDAYLATIEPPAWSVTFPGGVRVAIGAWLCNGAVCTLVVLAFALLSARELVQFFRGAGFGASGYVAKFFAAGFIVGPFIGFNLKHHAGWFDESWGLTWLALAVIVEFIMQGWKRRTQHALVNLAATVFIVVYTGVLAGYLTRLRMEIGGHTGTILLLFSILLVKLTDMGAFFSGTAFGRHKLIEWLSPKKTWEGLAGGVALTVLGAVGLGSYLRGAGLVNFDNGLFTYPWDLLTFGLLMALFSIAGDLCASMLKRDAALKDSGHAIPGMGGVLDVMDSPLLAAPAAWFFWTRLAAIGGAS